MVKYFALIICLIACSTPSFAEFYLNRGVVEQVTGFQASGGNIFTTGAHYQPKYEFSNQWGTTARVGFVPMKTMSKSFLFTIDASLLVDYHLGDSGVSIFVGPGYSVWFGPSTIGNMQVSLGGEYVLATPLYRLVDRFQLMGSLIPVASSTTYLISLGAGLSL